MTNRGLPELSWKVDGNRIVPWGVGFNGTAIPLAPTRSQSADGGADRLLDSRGCIDSVTGRIYQGPRTPVYTVGDIGRASSVWR